MTVQVESSFSDVFFERRLFLRESELADLDEAAEVSDDDEDSSPLSSLSLDFTLSAFDLSVRKTNQHKQNGRAFVRAYWQKINKIKFYKKDNKNVYNLWNFCSFLFSEKRNFQSSKILILYF